MLWDVFISHASEDKEAVALPLAEALSVRGLRVWLDRHELKLGDSLRESIDAGLAHSRFGVVVLSEAFLRKRWPQWELNGLMAVESAGTKAILPVWHGIGHADLIKHSPLLADRVAGNTADGIDALATAIAALVFAEPGGTPAVDDPTVAGRLLEVLGRGETAAAEKFVTVHPEILRQAFGRGWDEVRGAEIEDVGVLFVGAFERTPSLWRWRGIVLGSPAEPPIGPDGTATPGIEALAALAGRVRAGKTPGPRPELPDFRASDIELTAVAGRRADLSPQAAGALADFNDLHFGFRVRTYDWLVDAAVDAR